MTRSDLIERIQRKFPHLTQRNVEKIVLLIFSSIVDAIANGKRVEFRGFGSFTPRYRKARTARNPRTGEQVQIEAKVVPFFKHSRALRDKLNPKDGAGN